MARKYIKIQDIENLDIESMRSMTRDEAIRYYKAAKYYAESRQERALPVFMQRKSKFGNYPTPHAYKLRDKDKEGGDILSKREFKELSDDMTTNQIKHELRLARDFLKTKTSTVEGWDEVLKDFRTTLKNKTGITIKRKDYALFWDVYNAVTDYINEATVSSNYEIWREVAEIINDSDFSGLTFSDLAIEVINKVESETMRGRYAKSETETENPYDYSDDKRL